MDLAAQVRAQMGAPAFAQRRRRLDRAVATFWSALERKQGALWIAASEGRIDEDGRELRQSLLDDEGRDPIGAVDHARRLFRDRIDPDQDRKQRFNKAWCRHLDRCGLEGLEAQVADYNRYFPIEANLKTDPKTGRFLWMGTLWDEFQAPTLDDVLERFPLR